MDDDTVTVRFRDSTAQERVARRELTAHLLEATRSYRRAAVP